MIATDTSEKGLEALIVRHLAGISEHPPVSSCSAQEPTGIYAPGGYVLGRASDYNRDLALDVTQLLAFLRATQPKVVETLNLDAEGIQRTQFLHRLQGEISKRGVVDVLRKGVSHGPVHVDLYKLLPTQATPPRPRPSARTFSASPGRCATATTSPSARWTW